MIIRLLMLLVASQLILINFTFWQSVSVFALVIACGMVLEKRILDLIEQIRKDNANG